LSFSRKTFGDFSSDFYRAMLRRAQYWYSMSSVRASVRLLRWWLVIIQVGILQK